MLEVLLDAFAAILGHRSVVGHGDGVLRRMRMDEIRGRPRHGMEMPLTGVRFIRPRRIRIAVAGHGGVQVVEPRGEPFRQAARVDEHKRGVVAEDLVEDAALHGGPYRPGAFVRRCGVPGADAVSPRPDVGTRPQRTVSRTR